MAENKIEKKFKGTVVSTKMAKTAVVEISALKLHPKYKKTYKVSRKFKVHDEKGAAKVGEVVEFVSCRPYSKDKKWRLINK